MYVNHLQKLEAKGNIEKVKEFTRQVIKFNSTNTKLPDINDVLNSTQKACLKFLELRSTPNNGDTKIYNSQLMEFLGVSKSTIERILKKLEDYGFIARLTIKRKDYKTGGCKADRVIRCRRVMLRSRLNVLSRKALKWKTDIRPKFKLYKCIDEATGKVVHDKWFLNFGQKGRDAQTGEELKMAWETPFELERMGLWDGFKKSIIETYYDLMNLKQVDPNHKQANLIMGKRFATEYHN